MLRILRYSTSIAAILVGGLVTTVDAQRRGVYSAVPDTVHPESKYVFYIHGRIIETHGRRPTHPEFGVYEYDRILEALAGEDLIVISEVRPANTDVRLYGQKVADQVGHLLASGVPGSAITVVGFSKGGKIAIGISALLQEASMRYVFLGACSGIDTLAAGDQVTGRVLSIFETTDEIGVSCQPLLENSPETTETREIRIDTGHRHGAFYEPRDVWLVPTRQWITRAG
jgi:hypothetical protein